MSQHRTSMFSTVQSLRRYDAAFDHYLPHLLSLRLRGVDTRVGYPNSVPRALVDESFSSSRIALARRAAGSDEGVVG